MDASTHISDWNTLAALVKDARSNRGWSQMELAERANVSRAWIAKLERGHRGAELEQILRLFHALQMNIIAQPAGADTDEMSSAPRLEQPDRAAFAMSLETRRAASQRRRDAWADARKLTPDGEGGR